MDDFASFLLFLVTVFAAGFVFASGWLLAVRFWG